MSDTDVPEVEETDKPFRILPRIDDLNRAFWTGGERGELVFLRCQSCGYFVHPPVPFCPSCEGRELAPEPVSGRATVHTFTINHQPWMPGPELPYVVAIVEIAEQADLRLTTNIVGCPPGDVEIGMAVQVVFEHYDDVWIPLFEPFVAAGESVDAARDAS
ncbi:MAG: Zn-ribbon domain-containing OB-fold protein [Acidimicrobiia bacterium]|nr:Zn-ribbon domain-containing OB-fold protein [Acidimicrobiia bacterium]